MKWRIVKKKFNREKHRIIGTILCANYKDGTQIWSKVKNVRISPAGGNKIKYDMQTEPCDPPEPPKQESRYSNKGFSMSFDLKADKQTKRNIRKLVDQF